MSTTSRNKNLIFIIAVLLLTNIAVLGYFLWFKKPEQKQQHGRGGQGMMIEALQKEVGFTDEQIAEYKKLKDLQKETVRPMFDEMRKAKEGLFRLIADSTVSDSAIQAAGNAIAQQQKALDIETLNHFKKVRALCSSDEQRTKYDSAVLQMFRKMGKPRNNEQKKEEKK
jgi:periplasmic protein CpxP/Spy